MDSKKIKNQKGQSIFEFLIFLPLLVMLIGVFYSFGNSLNMSINQQKQVRGYFYYITKGNSYGITYGNLKELKDAGIRKVGMFSLGWRIKESSSGKNSFATCTKIVSSLSGGDEDCDSDSRVAEGASKFIRAFTMYGICTNSFAALDNGYFAGNVDPDSGTRMNQVGFSNCSLSK